MRETHNTQSSISIFTLSTRWTTTRSAVRVIDQTQRRVYLQENVPPAGKIVSIFEPHTDIIVKGAKDVAGKATRRGQEDFSAFVWASTLRYNLVRTIRFSSA